MHYRPNFGVTALSPIHLNLGQRRRVPRVRPCSSESRLRGPSNRRSRHVVHSSHKTSLYFPTLWSAEHHPLNRTDRLLFDTPTCTADDNILAIICDRYYPYRLSRAWPCLFLYPTRSETNTAHICPIDTHLLLFGTLGLARTDRDPSLVSRLL